MGRGLVDFGSEAMSARFNTELACFSFVEVNGRQSCLVVLGVKVTWTSILSIFRIKGVGLGSVKLAE